MPAGDTPLTESDSAVDMRWLAQALLLYLVGFSAKTLGPAHLTAHVLHLLGISPVASLMSTDRKLSMARIWCRLLCYFLCRYDIKTLLILQPYHIVRSSAKMLLSVLPEAVATPPPPPHTQNQWGPALLIILPLFCSDYLFRPTTDFYCAAQLLDMSAEEQNAAPLRKDPTVHRNFPGRGI